MSGSQVTGPVGPIDRTLFERAAQQLTRVLARPTDPPAEDQPARNDLARTPGPAGSVPEEEAARRLHGWLGEIVAGTGADMGNIQVYDPATRALRLQAQLGFREPFLQYFREVRLHEAACGTAFSSRATVIVADVATSPLFSHEARDIMLQAEARAVQSANLATPFRQKVGVVSVHYRRPGVPEESQRMLRRFAAALAEVVALCGELRPQH